MLIRPMTKKDLSSALDLWNNVHKHDVFLYKTLDEQSFESKFLNKTNDYKTISFVCLQNDCLIGFSSGVHMFNKETAYITAVLVAHQFKRKGFGTELLHALENELMTINSILKKIDIVFFNPIQFEWILPNTNNHDHPNGPGVDTLSSAYPFFKSLGYYDFALQNSYYKNIKDFQYSPKTVEKIENLKNNDISITLYSPKLHHGLEALFDDLKNEGWRKEITETAKKNSFPILIAEMNGLVIGFSGPLKVQKSMRGYFTGIGIHSEYRGYGAGSVLFSALCKHLKDLGAHYMTLFTGENNPARHIYEREGFQIVRSWADMRKDL